MLAIRLQRTGRSGHAMFRMVVQDSRRTPSSGAIVTRLGHYDPHAKNLVVDKEKAAFYLEHGAHPSPRAALLLKGNGVKLPKWVTIDIKKAGKTRNLEKLRRNRPQEETKSEQPVDQPSDETTSEAPQTNEKSEPTDQDAATEVQQ